MTINSIFKGILHGLQIGLGYAVPILQATDQAAPSPVLATLLGAMDALESLMPAAGAGPARKPIVAQIVNAVHPGIDMAALGQWIDEIVAQGNALKVTLGKVGV